MFADYVLLSSSMIWQCSIKFDFNQSDKYNWDHWCCHLGIHKYEGNKNIIVYLYINFLAINIDIKFFYQFVVGGRLFPPATKIFCIYNLTLNVALSQRSCAESTQFHAFYRNKRPTNDNLHLWLWY